MEQQNKYLVLDTNILLLDANNLTILANDETTIVLPETVINELDSKKSVPGELGYQARSFGRLIARGAIMKVFKQGNLVITPVTLEDGTHVHIASASSYSFDTTSVDPSTLNDRKIIDVALEYNKYYESVTYMSNDVMCRITALSLGLPAIDLKITEKTSYEFLKELDIPSDVFSSLHNTPIHEVNPDHQPENFNYRFHCPELGYDKLATVSRSGLIDVIGKTTEAELRRQDVSPVNSEQLLLSKAICDPFIDIIVVDSLAGSGKTITAISNAMKLIKQNNPFEGILYIRASINDVEQIEEVGFLPGLEEKFAGFYLPLRDSLEFIARSNSKQSKLKGLEYEEFIEQQVDKLMSDYNITAMTGLNLRGRTFTNKIIIIDEVQGQSKASLQKMLTRVGKDCKLILTGSNNQIDSPYVTKYNNGLSVLLNECLKPQDLISLYAIKLSRVIRSPMAEFVESAFTK